MRGEELRLGDLPRGQEACEVVVLGRTALRRIVWGRASTFGHEAEAMGAGLLPLAKWCARIWVKNSILRGVVVPGAYPGP